MSSPNITTNTGIDGTVSETYHGVHVPDPYRWLEDGQSPETHAWVEEQAGTTRRYLDYLPGRPTIAPRVAGLLPKETISSIVTSGNTLYYTKRQGHEEQANLFRRKSLEGPEELLLDIAPLGNELSTTVLSVSGDGRLIACGMRTGGTDAQRVRILDTSTGEFLSDELPFSLVRGFAFSAQSDGYLYVTEQPAHRKAPKEAKYHTLGAPAYRDRTVFSLEEDPTARLVSHLDQSSGIVIHVVVKATGRSNLFSLYVQSLRGPNGRVTTLIKDHPWPITARAHGSRLFLFLDQCDGKGRKLLCLPLGAADVDSLNLNDAASILTEGARHIQNWRIYGDWLVTTTIEDLASVVRKQSLKTGALDLIALPEAGTVNLLAGDDGGFFYSFESYIRPLEVYHFSFAEQKSTLFGNPTKLSTHLAVRQVQYKSADNTTVQLTLLGRPEVFSAGNAPVLLTAYGAAGVCLTPQYSVLATYLTDLGGLFGVAHIRGGSEFGQSWEAAGKRENRENVHMDFIAAAKFLASTGLANSAKIAIAGGSNAGLLVAVAMTRHPELFCAVLCLAPFTDMLRYHLFQNTQFYVEQYGSSQNPDDFHQLIGYSPYHNVCDHAQYPAVLVVSGAADQRCDPMHARKFVARLQAATSGSSEQRTKRPILLDWNPLRGHMPALSLTTRTAAIVDRLAFLCHHLGIEVN